MKASELKEGDTVSIELKVEGDTLMQRNIRVMYINGLMAGNLDFTLVNRPVEKVKKYKVVFVNAGGDYDISMCRYASVDEFNIYALNGCKAVSIIEHSMVEMEKQNELQT